MSIGVFLCLDIVFELNELKGFVVKLQCKFRSIQVCVEFQNPSHKLPFEVGIFLFYCGSSHLYKSNDSFFFCTLADTGPFFVSSANGSSITILHPSSVGCFGGKVVYDSFQVMHHPTELFHDFILLMHNYLICLCLRCFNSLYGSYHNMLVGQDSAMQAGHR